MIKKILTNVFEGSLLGSFKLTLGLLADVVVLNIILKFMLLGFFIPDLYKIIYLSLFYKFKYGS